MTATLVHRYQPRGAALELFKCREPEVLLSGPAGTGKSRACLEKIHATALAVPGMRALIVRKTAVSLSSTGLVTFREHVLPESIEAGVVTWYSGSPQEAASYRYANGSTVVIGGLDKATRIMSSEYDLIFVQEATELTKNDWEALTTRLRNGRVSYQQLMADCNPAEPTHWLKNRCDRGTTKMLHCHHEDNPRLHDGVGWTSEGHAYIGKLENLTGVRYKRLRHGQWSAAEGIIYEEWDESLHVIDSFKIPDDWTRWWSIDFGFVHPFVCQWWAEDPDGRLYLYREIFRTKRTVDQHAVDILAQVTDHDGRWTEPRPRAVICDHAAESRAVLDRELKLSTSAATKTVLDGIQAVQQRLRKQPDGKPRLFIFRDALVQRDSELDEERKPTCTAEEIPGYIWDTGAGKNPREQPLKVNDDGCDAMRYVVAECDMSTRPRLRSLSR